MKKKLMLADLKFLHKRKLQKLHSIHLEEESKITYIPDWIRKLSLKVGKVILPKYSYGPFEFFMNVMAMDMVGKSYGNKNLYNYFKSVEVI